MADASVEDDEGAAPRSSVARVASLALAAATIATFALGIYGFRIRPGDHTWLDDVYKTLQLFALATDEDGLNGALEVARFLAAGVSLVAVGAVLRQLFTEQLDRAVLRGRKGHVVIVGAGSTGRRLVRAYRQRGREVVVVDRSEATVPRRPNDGLKLIAVQGDPTDPRVLARARVQWADVVIAVCRTDAHNVPVIAAAAKLGESTSCTTTAYAHVPDETTHRVLVERSHLRSAGAEHPGMRVRYFNLVKRGVRSLLSHHPPFRRHGFVDERDPHVVVIGDGPVARALIVGAARLWPFVRTGTRKLRVTVVSPSADDVVDRLHDENPREAAVCRISVRDGLRGDPAWLDDATNVYVCAADDDRGLPQAMSVHAQAPSVRVVLVAASMSERAAGGLLAELGDTAAERSVHIFSLTDRTLTPELIEDPNTEVLARGIHARYVDEQMARGLKLGDRPSLRAWDELAPKLQESNRAQARHIDTKLREVGCALLPLSSTDQAPIRAFAREEIEVLAELEHERWVDERLAGGWVHGEVRDDDADPPTRPDLVPWDELDEPTANLDRQAVTNIPALLARVGFGAFRPIDDDR